MLDSGRIPGRLETPEWSVRLKDGVWKFIFPEEDIYPGFLILALTAALRSISASWAKIRA
jgi:hypothetical protein